MSDLIERQAAIDACHRDYDTILDFTSNGKTIADSFEDILNALPPAQSQPEIIHCKDCILKGTRNCIAITWCLLAGNTEPKDDFFCGLGTREESNDKS